MSEQVDYRELERLVTAQPQVHAADYYINARSRTQVVYDQTIQMGKSILEERDTVQLSPQTMVDMAVQSINNAIKALKGSAEQSNGAVTAPATSDAPVQRPVTPQPNSPAAFANATVQSPLSAATHASQQATGQEAGPQQSGSVQTTTPAGVQAVANPVQANRPQTVTVTPASSTVEPAQPDSVATTSAAANGDSLFLAGSATTDQSTSPADQPAPAASAQSMAQQAPTPTPAAQSTPQAQSKPSGQPLPTDQSTAPEAGSAVDLPRSSVTVNSPQQDPDTPERPSVGKAIWRGLQWTLGFKRNNIE